MSIDLKTWFENYAKLQFQKQSIPDSLYERWNVKRGLRNQDGTGVLVGLTQIGEVHGYIIDEGEKKPSPGRLVYRGIDLFDLVNGFQSDGRLGFEETAFLLLFGQLPAKEELEIFNEVIGNNRKLPPMFIEDMVLKVHSPNIMNKLARSVLALYSYDPNPEDYSLENIVLQSIGLIAKFPLLVAYGYQAKAHYIDKKSLFIHEPDPTLSTAENFLRLIRPDRKFTALEAELLDLALVLHAEHGGGNNSSFTIHVVSSAETDTYSAFAAGVGSLKGRKHGGANIKVTEMVKNIKENVSDWSNETQLFDYLCKIVLKEANDQSGLIYGMGHAVYTESDPRAVLLKEKARELASQKNRMEEFNLLANIEKLTPRVMEEVKENSKMICANVDLYSGLVYDMLNIPEELYTPLFAVARITGWSAHRIEEIVTNRRIIRPAYKSICSRQPYLPLSQRTLGKVQ